MVRAKRFILRSIVALGLAAAGTAITTDAQAAGPVLIDEVTPSVGRPGQATVFSITGSGFTPSTTATVSPDGTTESVEYVSSTLIRATVSFPSNARTGTRDLTVADGADDDLQTDIIVVRPTSGEYHPLTPDRLLDTRTAGQTKPGQGSVTLLTVTGVGGVPATGVSAVVLNVTATEPTTSTFVTVYPAGNERPTASNLNVVRDQTVPNLVTVAVGANGQVALYNHLGAVHLVADVNGWYGDAAAPGGGAFIAAIPPKRQLDTRLAGNGPVGTGGVVSVKIGAGGNTITAAALNVTVTEPTNDSFITVWPSGAERPLASNLNMKADQTVANMVIARVGPDGLVNFYNHTGSTHLVVDLLGVFDDASLPVFGGQFEGTVPVRLLDTRDAAGATTGQPLAETATLVLPVAGRVGVPVTASAVVVNVTATEPTSNSYLTVWPSDEAQPTASNLNMAPGDTVPNLAVVPLAIDGSISIYNHGGNTHVVLDVVGWYR